MRNNTVVKNILRFCVLLAVCYLLNGCATVPYGGSVPIYSLGGRNYLPLVPLCEQKGISWEYDPFTKTIVLSKGVSKVSLMVGQTFALINGKSFSLRHPVDIYNGTVVVPYSFRERLDDFFKGFLPAPQKAVSPVPLIKKIVIDAGHGGNDPGAVGKNGLKEKDVTLDVARRVTKLLRDKGMEVVMTRSDDTFIPLARRVEISNSANADLFISIHANANRVRSLNGFEVYFVSPEVSDSQRAISAAQNAKLNLNSSCFSGSSTNLKTILWDMIFTSNRAESIELAQAICRVVNRELSVKILGIKKAAFFVLKGARMPAVLIEIGFVSNYNEEKLLKNSSYRQQIVETIVRGIENYIADRSLAELEE